MGFEHDSCHPPTALMRGEAPDRPSALKGCAFTQEIRAHSTQIWSTLE